eukprot:922732-Amorphochlora_amoeboformis.AAC.2
MKVLCMRDSLKTYTCLVGFRSCIEGDFWFRGDTSSMSWLTELSPSIASAAVPFFVGTDPSLITSAPRR